MRFALKILDKAVRFPLRVWEHVQERLKKDSCTVDRGVRLYLSCQIWNFPGIRRAIAIGADSHLRGQIAIFANGSVRIGKACFVGENSRIWSANSISLGDRVLVSHGVNIHDNNAHSSSATLRFEHFQQIRSTGHPPTLEDVESAPIVIEDDVWIGFNSTILKGVTIGKGAIIGAASLVNHDVPAYTIVAGNPARVIGISRP